MHFRLLMPAFIVLTILVHLVGVPTTGDADVKKALALNKQGEKLLAQGKFKEAVATFREMLDNCGKHKYCAGVANFYLGRSHLEVAQYEAARKFLDRAESIFQGLKKKNGVAMVVVAKGKVFVGRGDYKQALECFKKAEETYTELKNRKELFNLYNNIAVVLAYKCDFDGSLKYLDKAAGLIGDSKDPKLLGPLNTNRGLVHSKRQDYEAALAHYKKAKENFESLGNKKGLSVLLNNVGYIHEARSEYKEALDSHRESLKLAGKIHDPWSEALALNNIGCVQLKRGDYKAANEALEKAFKIRQDLKMRHFAAETLNNIGLVWLAYADYANAYRSFDSARKRCELAGSLSGKAWALHNLAFLFKDQGKFKESLASSEEAVKIARQIGDRRLEATAILRLGNLYEYQGWFEKALENYEKAAEIQKEISDWNFRANTLVDIAGILTRSGSSADAEKYYGEAIDLKRKIGAPTGELLCRLALFYLEKDRYAGLRRQTLEARAKQKDLDLAKARETIKLAKKEIKPDQKNDLMLLSYVSGRYALEKDPGQAVKQFKSLASMAESSGVGKFAFLAEVQLGQAYEKLQDWSAAKAAFKKAVDYAEKIRETLDPQTRLTFLGGEEILGVKHILPYEGLARVLMRKGEKSASLTAAEYTKARSFAESLSRRWENPSFDVPIDIIKRDLSINNKLAALMKARDMAHQHGAPKAVRYFDKEIGKLKAVREKHIDELRKKYPLFAGSKYPGPVELGQTALTGDEWVLAYDVTDGGVLVYLTKGKKLVKGLFKPVGREELDRLVRAFREPLEIVPGKDDPLVKLKSFDLAVGKKLSDILLKDILSDLPKDAPVVIVPDDSLGIVPFEMLVLNDSGRIVDSGDELPYVDGADFFVDRNPVSYYQSITALTLSRTLGTKKSPEDRLLVVADPVFSHFDARAPELTTTRLAAVGGDFNVSLMSVIEDSSGGGLTIKRLPLTGELANDLYDMFGESSEMYTGLDASKKTVVKELAPDLTDYGKIVFATHGFFSKDCPHFKEPVLILSLMPRGTDGFLRMSEVMGLKLNSDIVALTACQTGLGKHVSGEGTMGMGRAFQYAGARAVLMTLWSVSEDSSVQLVETFFEQLKGGKDKLEAMRLAREAIRDEGFDHPFFWAPFIIVGEVN